MTSDACVCVSAKRVGGLANEEPIDNITVETCIKACSAKDYPQGGVAGNQCCTCFSIPFDEHSSTDQTSLLKFVINIAAAESY